MPVPVNSRAAYLELKDKLDNWAQNVAVRLERVLGHRQVNAAITITTEPITAKTNLVLVKLQLSGAVYAERRIGAHRSEHEAMDQALHALYGMVDILEVVHDGTQEGYPLR